MEELESDPAAVQSYSIAVCKKISKHKGFLHEGSKKNSIK